MIYSEEHKIYYDCNNNNNLQLKEKCRYSESNVEKNFVYLSYKFPLPIFLRTFPLELKLR